jgi:ATP-binding cassette subfamily B protein
LKQIVLTYGTFILSKGLRIWVYLFGWFLGDLRYDLRQKMFNHLQNSPFRFFNRNPVGRFISRVTSDSDRVADLILGAFWTQTWAISTPSRSYFYAVYSLAMTLIILCIIPILF